MQVMTASTDPLSACSGEENKSYSLLLCLRGGVDSRNEGSPERVNVTQGCGGRGEGLGRPEFVTIRCRARIGSRAITKYAWATVRLIISLAASCFLIIWGCEAAQNISSDLKEINK
jgi:hypothetical protein